MVAVVVYASFLYVLQHATSFRADPLITAFLMAAIFALTRKTATFVSFLLCRVDLAGWADLDKVGLLHSEYRGLAAFGKYPEVQQKWLLFEQDSAAVACRRADRLSGALVFASAGAFRIRGECHHFHRQCDRDAIRRKGTFRYALVFGCGFSFQSAELDYDFLRLVFFA